MMLGSLSNLNQPKTTGNRREEKRKMGKNLCDERVLLVRTTTTWNEIDIERERELGDTKEPRCWWQGECKKSCRLFAIVHKREIQCYDFTVCYLLRTTTTEKKKQHTNTICYARLPRHNQIFCYLRSCTILCDGAIVYALRYSTNSLPTQKSGK